MEESIEYIIDIIPQLRMVDPENKLLKHVNVKDSRLTLNCQFGRDYQSNGEPFEEGLRQYASDLEMAVETLDAKNSKRN